MPATASNTRTRSRCIYARRRLRGLDICTDGDAHYDDEVGGMSWQSYPNSANAIFLSAFDLYIDAIVQRA